MQKVCFAVFSRNLVARQAANVTAQSSLGNYQFPLYYLVALFDFQIKKLRRVQHMHGGNYSVFNC